MFCVYVYSHLRTKSISLTQFKNIHTCSVYMFILISAGKYFTYPISILCQSWPTNRKPRKLSHFYSCVTLHLTSKYYRRSSLLAYFAKLYHHHHHHHHIFVMELGHLLICSSLTYPEVSSKVCHNSFCQLGIVFHYPG